MKQEMTSKRRVFASVKKLAQTEVESPETTEVVQDLARHWLRPLAPKRVKRPRKAHRRPRKAHRRAFSHRLPRSMSKLTVCMQRLQALPRIINELSLSLVV
jgi:hypothetical protein